jgi:hypothetical protein
VPAAESWVLLAAVVVVLLVLVPRSGTWGTTAYVKLRMTGFPVVAVVVPEVVDVLVLDDEELLELVLLPDELELEDEEPEVDAVLVPELLVDDFDAEDPAFVLLLALDFAVATAVPPEPFVPPEFVVPLWVPLPVVPPWVEVVPEVVPDRPLAPAAPVPAVPPTMPISASTSQRTTVLLALSSVPFSTMSSATSPRSTATSSNLAPVF